MVEVSIALRICIPFRKMVPIDVLNEFLFLPQPMPIVSTIRNLLYSCVEGQNQHEAISTALSVLWKEVEKIFGKLATSKSALPRVSLCVA